MENNTSKDHFKQEDIDNLIYFVSNNNHRLQSHYKNYNKEGHKAVNGFFQFLIKEYEENLQKNNSKDNRLSKRLNSLGSSLSDSKTILKYDEDLNEAVLKGREQIKKLEIKRTIKVPNKKGDRYQF